MIFFWNFFRDVLNPTSLIAAQLFKLRGFKVVASISRRRDTPAVTNFGIGDIICIEAGESINSALEAYFPSGIDVMFDCSEGDVYNEALSMVVDF